VELKERPGTVIDRYVLLEPLGQGGMGIVYLAEQLEPINRKVALKVIKLGMDTWEVINRFEAERQTLAMMDHPNIAKIIDGGATDSGRPFFVMEYVQGIPITKFADLHRLSVPERLELFIKVCAAIQHAHQKGVIHRDLKPSNILVAYDGSGPEPKVIDFGLAKATDSTGGNETFNTRLHQVMGTPAYMSPEQASFGEVDIDTRSDVYALGVLLYELLSARTPFAELESRKTAYTEIGRIIREVEPVRPSLRLATLTNDDLEAVANSRKTDPKRLKQAISQDLDWIVLKALEKDRQRRYPTANALANDVVRYLSNEPVVAAAPDPIYVVKKFIRRHRSRVVASAALALMLLATVAISVSMAIVANTSRKNETRSHGQALNALQLMRIRRAEDSFRTGDAALGLAHLARVLRDNPTNGVAAQRILSALLGRAYHLPVGEPMRHTAGIKVAVFSPVENRVLTASKDGAAQLWEGPSGQPSGPRLQHGSAIYAAVFSADGRWMATGSEDGAVKIWNSGTSREAMPGYRQELAISAIQFSHNGRWLASGGHDGHVYLLEVGAGSPPRRIVTASGWINALSFNPDDSRLLVVAGDGSMRFWDLRSGALDGSDLDAGSNVNHAEFSRDGTRFIAALENGTAQIWDTGSKTRLGQPMGHKKRLSVARFSDDGEYCATVSDDGTARVWNGRTGEPVTPYLKHSADVTCTRFSPNGLWLITGSDDKTARIWNAHTGAPLGEPIRHLDQVWAVGFSPDGETVVTGAGDGIARLWRVQTNQKLGNILNHPNRIRSIQFSPDQTTIVTAGDDRYARLWDAKTGHLKGMPMEDAAGFKKVTFSRNGRWLLSVGQWSDKVHVWDAQTGAKAGVLWSSTNLVEDAEFSPDGRWIATASRDQNAHLWGVPEWRPAGGAMRHDDYVWTVRFSADGQYLVTASEDRTARTWQVPDGRPMGPPLRHTSEVRYAEFNPDTTAVVTSSNDRVATVWNPRTGEAVGGRLNHSDVMPVVRFSSDGSLIVTASFDHSCRIWDARTQAMLGDDLIHSKSVDDAVFAARDRVVMTSCDSGVFFWDTRTGQPMQEAITNVYEISTASLNPDETAVAIGIKAPEQSAIVWDLEAAPVPVPIWVCDWAESLAGLQILSDGTVRDMSSENGFRRLKEHSQSPATNIYSKYLAWFLSPPSARMISPMSAVTVAEYLDRRVAVSDWNCLYEVLALSPTNSLAYARLGELAISSPGPLTRQMINEARYFVREAHKVRTWGAETEAILETVRKRVAGIESR